MKSKSLVITILITALIYWSGLDQARSETLPDQMQRVDDQVQKIEKTLEALRQNVKESLNKELPIGTIIASVLDPDQFKEQLENTEKSKWVLADGKDYVNAKINVPNLLGMFLRGMNVDGKGVDPGPERKAGELQEDALQQHGHETKATQQGWNQFGHKKQGYTSGGYAHIANVTEVKDARTADETRPKNAAVYFYIKIK